mgnify:CR=1 FL=1
MTSDHIDTGDIIERYAMTTDINLDGHGPLGYEIAQAARTLDGLVNGLGVGERLLKAREHIRAVLLLVEPIVQRIDKP